MTTLKELKAKLLANPDVRREYDALAMEHEIARAVIRARIAAGLTQTQLADLMGTRQSFVAKLESGRTLPSATTLTRVGKATGTRPHFELIPLRSEVDAPEPLPSERRRSRSTGRRYSAAPQPG